MHFKQFYLGCLSHASYYIGSGDEAAVIDPQRDVQQYLDEAAANGQQIRYVIETHSHADFVSGHVELAAKTGAQIVYGQKAATLFPTLKVKDGDKVTIGAVELSFLETPGHTPEGITVIAKDNESTDAPLRIFTGDTLFIGDVGRPDLIGSKGFTAEQMGSMLYDSLHSKIMPLPDDTEVYPAHGAGSLCGKSLSKETWSTLGNQKKFNYALQPMAKEEFIRLVASDQPHVPAYFPKSAERNLAGPAGLEELSKPRAFSPEEVADFEGIVVDVRQADEYGFGHIPGAVNIGLGGQFASWAGTLIPIGTPIVIAANTEKQIEEAVVRLARVGHESVKGFILMSEWDRETSKIEQVTINEASERTAGASRVQFVDVRRPAEYSCGHAAEAINLTLSELNELAEKLEKDCPTYVICQGGYRSSMATSILERAGFSEVYNVTGGTGAWIEAGLPTDEVTEVATK